MLVYYLAQFYRTPFFRASIFSVHSIDANVLATGDDDGCIKVSYKYRHHVRVDLF